MKPWGVSNTSAHREESHPSPCPSAPSLPLSWLCHPSWESVGQKLAGCKSQRLRTPSSSCSTSRSRNKKTSLITSVLNLYREVKKRGELELVFRKVSSSTVYRLNQTGRTLSLLALEHATTAKKKGRGWREGVSGRIQHEHNLQYCLSHAERRQSGVPNTSILKDRRCRQKSGLLSVNTHESSTNIPNLKENGGLTALQAASPTLATKEML